MSTNNKLPVRVTNELADNVAVTSCWMLGSCRLEDYQNAGNRFRFCWACLGKVLRIYRLRYHLKTSHNEM